MNLNLYTSTKQYLDAFKVFSWFQRKSSSQRQTTAKNQLKGAFKLEEDPQSDSDSETSHHQPKHTLKHGWFTSCTPFSRTKTSTHQHNAA